LNIACLSIHSSPLGRPGSKDTGGMSTYLRELSSVLGLLGHRVDLYTAAAYGGAERIRALGPNVRLITISAGSGCRTKLDLYPRLDSLAGEVGRVCYAENSRYDLIFSHYWLSGLVGQILKKSWGLPHLVMFHTLGAAKNDFCRAENEPDFRLRAEQALVFESDGVVAASQREKQLLCTYYQASPDQISVIPCGVNLELFRPFAQKQARKKSGLGEGKIILYVGRIEPVKGLDLLLHAFAALRGNGYECRLIIAGGDEHSAPAVEMYRRLARQLGIGAQVTFTGLIEHSMLPYYYGAADVTVAPSYYESFGMTALESLACGTPVAAADVGDLREIILPGRTGNVIREHKPELLAEAIADLVALPRRPLELCRSSVLSYNWPVIAGLLVDEFRIITARE